MSNQQHSQSLIQHLQLDTPPVAISFLDEAPANVPHVNKRQAAGCGYWQVAVEHGEAFYTDATDHYGCAVGAHTHRVDLPVSIADELQSVVGTMLQLQYLREAEIPAIPQRMQPFRFAVYAPLAQAASTPDVVMLRATPGQLMLLAEAATAADIYAETATMGRPTCALVPQVTNSQCASASFGCIGNRVYTGLKDHQAYFALPGSKLTLMVQKLVTIVAANEALARFHTARAGASLSA